MPEDKNLDENLIEGNISDISDWLSESSLEIEEKAAECASPVFKMQVSDQIKELFTLKK